MSLRARLPLSRPIRLISLAGLLWLGVFLSDVFPSLHGDLGGRWPFAWPADPLRLLPLGLTLVVYLAGAYWLRDHAARPAQLAWALVGSVAATLASLSVTADPLFKLYSVTVSGVATGWHYTAADITDFRAALSQWPAIMRASESYTTHVGIAPPGAEFIYYLGRRGLEGFPAIAQRLAQPLRAALCLNPRIVNYSDPQLASAWLGVVMPVWSGLTVLPLSRLGRRLFDEATAWWACLWWPLIPSLLLFAPTLNTFFPLLTVLMLALQVEGIHRDQPVWFLGAGLLLSILTFISFALLPLIFLAGVFTLSIYLARARLPNPPPTARHWTWPIRAGAWFGIGLTLCWVLAYGVAGMTPWAIAVQAARAHLAVDYPYWPWTWLHANDYLMFTGWPLALAATLGLFRVARRWRAGRMMRVGEILCAATGLTLIALDFSGTLRGETGRILVFFTPCVLLGAAWALADETKPDRAGWSLTIVQALIVFGMAAVLRVVDTEYNRPPLAALPAVVAPAAPVFAGDAVFESALRLDSFAGRIELRAAAGQPAQPVLKLWLNWRSQGQAARVYDEAFIPVNPQGQPAGAALHVSPFAGAYPTTCWTPGDEVIQQVVDVPLNVSRAAGAWWVSLTLYDRETGTAAQVVRSDGHVDQQTGLGPFDPQP